MSDEAKLGLVAGVLAVVGVATFGVPKEPAKPDVVLSAKAPAATTPPPANVANK